MMIKAIQIYKALREQYETSFTWWPGTPFEIMVSAVLVQNTNWKNAERSMNDLGHPLTPETVRSWTAEELEEKIRTSGFQKRKAKTIQGLAAWMASYHDRIENASRKSIESLRNELLSIKGIGRETADDILVYALHKPAWIVDAYTRRLLRSLGLSFASDEEIRNYFSASIPLNEETAASFHGWILEQYIHPAETLENLAGRFHGI